MNQEQAKGFTLVEMLISTSLMVVIMLSVFLIVTFHIDMSKTQDARVRLQQESRFFLSSFASDLKNAGAVLSIANTPGFLSSFAYFNGIYPLNSSTYADGIIVATGDPQAVTTLTQEYTPGNPLIVKDTVVPYPAVSWSPGDKGIVIGTTGYYIFAVESVDVSSITPRDAPVYYSGMLNSPQTTSGTNTDYVDSSSPSGDGITYPINAPVIRLSDFSIYLVDERDDLIQGRKIRELVRVTDANGDSSGSFLSPTSAAVKGVIAENIWDFQVSYICYPNFPDDSVKNIYFTISSPGSLDDLLTDIQTKALKEIRVNVVALTDEYAGKGTFTLQVPDIGDRNKYNLPVGKYTYKVFTLTIEPRNFNIML